MEANRAKLVLRVPEVATALGFYTRGLGWEPREIHAAERYALLQVPDAGCALLAGEGLAAHTERRLTAPGGHVVEAAGRFYLPAPGDPGALAQLQQRALAEGGRCEVETEPCCWRTVTVHTPQGYRAAYWVELFPTEEETLEVFAAGPAGLEAALAGLEEPWLDLARAPGTWSIRQQVLHVVDLELVALHKLKFILAEPVEGRVYTGHALDQDAWAEAMRYAARPIRAEAAMFRLLREHVLSLCEHMPSGALQRSVIAGGRTETAARLIKMMAGHANVHIRRIREIRELHGR
ncbi:glyoxalase [Paenibacillus cremeus]|uniref:Glyoxalase n=2 Tax=Paenibacillus cremeus TaxID=2163881 RepID=A0A559KA84_9BACL|nr:glyoxalase [Paenibacillus cremeus]